MSIVAALQWQKTQSAIAILIFHEKSMQLILPPKIFYLPKGFFKFRSEVKKIIKFFFDEIMQSYQIFKEPIIVEYKIVFDVAHLRYLTPSMQSRFVYKTFLYWFLRTKKQIKNIKLSSQLRQKLSGRPLKQFNTALRKMNLVSRKKSTRFEYTLWAVALHATAATYEVKINKIKQKIMDLFWQTKPDD